MVAYSSSHRFLVASSTHVFGIYVQSGPSSIRSTLLFVSAHSLSSPQPSRVRLFKQSATGADRRDYGSVVIAASVFVAAVVVCESVLLCVSMVWCCSAVLGPTGEVTVASSTVSV